MSAAQEQALARPKLDRAVVLGPAQYAGPAVIHHVKHTGTGWFYRVGPKEHFLLSRMDGTRTLPELEDAYREAFGRNIGEQGWQQLFGLLGRRALLEGSADDARLAELRAAQVASQRERQGLLRRRYPLIDPDAFLQAAAARLRPVLRRAVVVPLGVAVAAMVAFVALAAPELYAAWRGSPSFGAVSVAAFALVWATAALHELGHGLACAHFGGRVPEIGVMWRFPLLAPYCKADDSVLFDRRGKRVLTAFAGMFVHLITLLPAVGVWWAAAEGSAVRGLAAAVLLVGTVSALINLVPFLQLDGYFMLTHALGMADLRLQTYRYWGTLLRRGGGDGSVKPRYRPQDRVVYTLYGVAFGLFAVALAGGLVTAWFLTLRAFIGAVAAVAFLVAEAVVIGALVAWLVRRRAARAAAGG